MGLEIVLPIFGVLVGLTAILTSRFFGNLTLTVWINLRDAAIDTFGDKLWVKAWYWWPIRFGQNYFTWLIRVCGAAIVLVALFILVWVYILGN